MTRKNYNGGVVLKNYTNKLSGVLYLGIWYQHPQNGHSFLQPHYWRDNSAAGSLLPCNSQC